MTGRRPNAASGGDAPSLLQTVGVVIPLFNKAAWIEDTLKSILSQTIQPGEILVVDDGSTDGSREIATRVGGPHIRLLTTASPQSGPSVARNQGIRASRSNWIALLDADDQWRADYLAKVMSAILDNPDVGCVFSGRAIGQDAAVQHPPALFGDRAQKLDFEAYLDLWLATGQRGLSPIHSSASVIRKSVLEAAGLFPEGCNRGEDKDTWLRVMGKASAIFIPAPLVRYRDNIPGQLNRKPPPFESPPILATAIALSQGAETSTRARTMLLKLASREAWLYARRRRLHPIDAATLTATDFRVSPFRFIAVRMLYLAGLIAGFSKKA